MNTSSKLGHSGVGALLALASLVVSGTITTQSAQAQTLTVLHSFDDTTDGDLASSLIQATDGNLYGTTAEDGANFTGTVFSITPSGTLSILSDLCVYGSSCTIGEFPNAGLVQAPNGDLYGTTADGGTEPSNDGTVFKVTLSGEVTVVHSFEAPNGSANALGLILAGNGDLYGTTESGGTYGTGIVYKINPSGKVTTVYNFDCPNNTDCPAAPPDGRLVQATNGDFYGATLSGGANSWGSIFKMTPSGTLTTLYSFADSTDGAYPVGTALIQATNGDFYGTTSMGAGGGTVFKMTAAGKLTTLHSFCSQTDCTDGSKPNGLIQASDGNFYGTTATGGAADSGTIFEITARGKLTTLYSFCSQADCADGQSPVGLIQDTNGDFYGTSLGGGANGDGTVFSLSVGLGPFVETQTTSGTVGATVNILGTSLTGVTSVTFNGTAATFTVNSTGTEITTTVPTGATTGYIDVVTPSSGTLQSNVVYRVKP